MALKTVNQIQDTHLTRDRNSVEQGTAGSFDSQDHRCLEYLYVLSSEHCVLHVPADVTGRDVSWGDTLFEKPIQ